MAQQITYDKAYDAVAPDDFAAMLEVPRYGRRTDAFDGIISATHDHFWDPLDKTYIDFDQPFDIATTPIMPLDTVVELRSAVADRLVDNQKIQLANDVTHWSISNLLHGEQGALSLSASLCHVLVDPGAQEYAANQAREEARHVAGFTRYIAARWGDPLPVGKTIETVLKDLVSTPEVYKKIVGMQMLVEGIAMGAFATFNAKFGSATTWETQILKAAQLWAQQTNINFLSWDAINNALNVGPGGQCLTGGGTCVPYQLFKQGAVSPDQIAYLNSLGTQTGWVRESIISGSITGDLGKYGAGIVYVADQADLALYSNKGYVVRVVQP